MMRFIYTRIKAIRYALAGWSHVIQTQRNTWVHTIASITVLLLGTWVRLPMQDWAVLILTIAIVWVAEFFNTAIETLLDFISPDQSHLAKISKDVSAAAVLIAAVASVIIGLLILGPPLLSKISALIGQ